MAGAVSKMAARQGRASHQSFLRHRDLFYAKLAVGLSILAVIAYALVDPAAGRNGGSWLGYTLGVAAAALILWLTLLGVRKRAITAGAWSLKGWTSAHVYLGLSLIVLATLHTGFQFGLNIHTLAYVLMLIVIGSGLFGIYYYATIPAQMSDNRGEMSGEQMLAEIAGLDEDLRAAAQPLGEREAELIRRAIEDTRLARGVFDRLQLAPPRCPTAAALAAFRSATLAGEGGEEAAAALTLLERKQAMLLRARRHARARFLLELWLYVHVPMTFALIAALIAHVIAVFYFW